MPLVLAKAVELSALYKAIVDNGSCPKLGNAPEPMDAAGEARVKDGEETLLPSFLKVVTKHPRLGVSGWHNTVLWGRPPHLQKEIKPDDFIAK